MKDLVRYKSAATVRMKSGGGCHSFLQYVKEEEFRDYGLSYNARGRVSGRLAVLGLIYLKKVKSPWGGYDNWAKLTRLGYHALLKLEKTRLGRYATVKIAFNQVYFERASNLKIVDMLGQLRYRSETRRWLGIEKKAMFKIPLNGLTHSLLRKAASGRCERHSHLRHSAWHAREIQQALVFGLVVKCDRVGYRITNIGRQALKRLDEFKCDEEYRATCNRRVDCLVGNCVRDKVLVEIPIRPAPKWVEYFKTRVW